MNYNDYVVFQNRIGIIVEKHEGIDYHDYNNLDTAYSFVTYRVIVAGIEGKKHFVYEEEIEGKIE
jgi:hypothetical protein